MRTQKAQKLRRSRRRNTKIVWKRLEPVFMRVAGHKWLGRRMGAGCLCFCGLAWGGGIRGRTQKAQKLRRSRKSNTKIVWKRLEPVFMRVAGHKWLGRRMGAGCLCFCGFAWGAGLRGRTQKAQKLRRSRRRNTKIFKKLGKQHSPAFPASSQKPVIPAQAGIHGCASYDDGLPPRAFAGQVGAS